VSSTHDWMKSPAGKVIPNTPRHGLQAREFELGERSPEAMPRRRLRAKSPDPQQRHAVDWRDELGFMGSPPRRQDLSPTRTGTRKRITGKSPDPQQKLAPWDELGFLGSPLAARRGGLGVRIEESPSPRTAAPLTPGRRLRQKTSEVELLLHQPQPSAVPVSTDPADALLLLSRRELVEMCMECGVSTVGAKSVLIASLVTAHAAPPAPPAPIESLAISPQPDTAVVPDRCEAASSVQVSEPPRRVSLVPPQPSSWGAAPLPSAPPPSSWGVAPLPSSWKLEVSDPTAKSEVAPPLPSSWKSADVCETSTVSELVLPTPPSWKSAERPSGASEPAAGARLTLPTAKVVQSEATSSGVACSPTPARSVRESLVTQDATGMLAEDASPEECAKHSSGTSNDWWRNVALRWPKIVANLKAATGSHEEDTAPSSPVAAASSVNKRSFGSPSVLDGFPSPKRHCPAALASSPARL